jgi:molybdate transport system substrate-binding protein
VDSFKAVANMGLNRSVGARLSLWCRTLVGAGIVIAVSACGGHNKPADGPQASKVLVAAASDLRFAFTDLGERFKQATDIDVTFTFGSSGQLKEQIINGAPFDLFASANEQFTLDVVNADKGWPETVQSYARGRIVMVARQGFDVPLSLVDLVGQNFVRIAIAHPAHAPYGIAAREALESVGVYEDVKSRLVLGENVSDTLRLVESGNVDVAIVALSLVVVGDAPYELIPENLHTPLKQSIVVTKTGDNEKSAREFVEFLFSQSGRTVMESYGFVLPAESK